MRISMLPPAEVLVHFMNRIYGRGMTTTSGGNLSVRDEAGDLWITPGDIDKGSLRAEDIVRVDPSGKRHGIHEPSVELPFHRAIYAARPDVRAVVHAHSPALVTFSVLGEVPDTGVFPRAAEVCGEVSVAPYALPGSARLGEHVAREFAVGRNAVLLANHGATTAGATPAEAFLRFETLEFCCRLLIHSRRIGTPVSLPAAHRTTQRVAHAVAGPWDDYAPTTEEKELRQQLTRFVRRAYGQSLFTSTEGAFGARCGDGRLVVTPHGVDRFYVEPEDFVAMRDGRAQGGREPSWAWKLIQDILDRQPALRAVIIAQPPYTMAFAVTGAPLTTPVIPESYVLLRDVPQLPFNAQVENPALVASTLSAEHPVILIRNECTAVAGETLLKAFDRLEVTEFTAKALVAAAGIGKPRELTEEQKEEIRRVFFR